jgi:hypothetical protein
MARKFPLAWGDLRQTRIQRITLDGCIRRKFLVLNARFITKMPSEQDTLNPDFADPHASPPTSQDLIAFVEGEVAGAVLGVQAALHAIVYELARQSPNAKAFCQSLSAAANSIIKDAPSPSTDEMYLGGRAFAAKNFIDELFGAKPLRDEAST